MRSFVSDGNFTADHLRQRRPEDDVWLTSGEGVMAERKAYAAHLAIAKETTEVLITVIPPADICALMHLQSIEGTL
jgi:hypothetical protein